MYAAEYVVPAGEFHGFIDVVKTQPGGVVGFILALFHIYKDLYGAV